MGGVSVGVRLGAGVGAAAGAHQQNGRGGGGLLVQRRQRAPVGRLRAKGVVVKARMRALHDGRHVQRGAVQGHRAAPGLRAGLVGQAGVGVEQGNQMRAGRVAHQHQAGRVAAPARRLVLDKGQCARQRLRLLARRGVRQQRVVHRQHNHALRRPALHLVQKHRRRALVAQPPGAAMHHQH